MQILKKIVNLKIIYRKQRENVELNFEFTRLETFVLFDPLANDTLSTSLETIKEILIPCFQMRFLNGTKIYWCVY